VGTSGTCCAGHHHLVAWPVANGPGLLRSTSIRATHRRVPDRSGALRFSRAAWRWIKPDISVSRAERRRPCRRLSLTGQDSLTRYFRGTYPLQSAFKFGGAGSRRGYETNARPHTRRQVRMSRSLSLAQTSPRHHLIEPIEKQRVDRESLSGGRS
jgi:hypothetical protein